MDARRGRMTADVPLNGTRKERNGDMAESRMLDAESVLRMLERTVAKPSPGEAAVTVDEFIRYAAWMKSARGYEPSREALNALLAYMRGYGLMLCGGVGTGKTMFFRSLKTRVEAVSPLRLMSRRLDDIERDMDGLDGVEVVIDDIGAEPVYSNFGSRLDLLPWLVEVRLASPMRTHFTTNLQPEGLVKRYGARVVDRLREMCRTFTLSGGSRRRAKVAAPAAGKGAA